MGGSRGPSMPYYGSLTKYPLPVVLTHDYLKHHQKSFLWMNYFINSNMSKSMCYTLITSGARSTEKDKKLS